MSDFTPSVNPGIREPVDALGRPTISAQMKARINAEFAIVPEGKRSALLVIVDDTGVARAHLAARLGDSWKVAAGGGFAIREKKPVGFIGIMGSW